MIRKIKLDNNRWVLAFAILLIVTFVLKVILILNVSGPVVYGDELLYKKRAMELFYEHRYYSTSYPPGYPFVLSVAFIFKDFYTVMKIINILLALTAYLAIWKICRLFIDCKNSFICVLVVTLLPWQYIICTRIMSENLYFPLLFWTLYFFIQALFDLNISIKKCVFGGILLAALQLTRHITIVILPVFALFWIVGFGKDGKIKVYFNKRLIFTGLAVLCGYFVLYGGWVFLRLIQGDSFGKIIGLQISNGIGRKAIAQYATGTTLILFIILYMAYMILSVLYSFAINAIAIHECIKGRVEEKLAKTVFLIIGVSVMLIVAAVRHSWRSSYNYPNVAYILGRYLIYISAMWIMLGKIFEFKIDFVHSKKKMLVYQVLEILLIVLAILILVKDCFFNLHENFLDNISSKEVYYLYELYWVVICLAIIKLFLLIWKEKWYFKITNYALLFTFLIGSIISVNHNEFEKRGGLGAVLNEYANKNDMKQYDFMINDTPAVSLKADIEFWSTPKTHLLVAWELSDDRFSEKQDADYYENYTNIYIINNEQIIESEDILLNNKGLVFCETSDKYKEDTDYIYKYIDKTYGIYHYPIELKTPAKNIEIVQTYPEVINCGEGFNVNENGDSGFAIQTNADAGVYEVWINGKYYVDMVIGEDGLGAFVMEPRFYNKEGNIEIQVREKYASYVKLDLDSAQANTYRVEVRKN